MSAIRSYRDLDAWQMSMRLAREGYCLTNRFPRSEQFGLSQQLRRAAVSIPSNLAEGNGSRKRQMYIHHINIALGSLAELETQLVLAVELELVKRDETRAAESLAAQAGRLMLALVHALEAPRAS
jgi:four helix bundle protein